MAFIYSPIFNLFNSSSTMGHPQSKISGAKDVVEDVSTGTHFIEIHMPSAGLSLATVIAVMVVIFCFYLCYRACCGGGRSRYPGVEPRVQYIAAPPPATQFQPPTGRLPMGPSMSPTMFSAFMRREWTDIHHPSAPFHRKTIDDCLGESETDKSKDKNEENLYPDLGEEKNAYVNSVP